MKCTRCGAENAENSQFCLACGNALQNNQMPQQQNYNQPMQGQMQYNQQMMAQQPKKGLGAGVVVIIVIAAIIGVLSILGVIFTPILLNIIDDAKNEGTTDGSSNVVEESSKPSTNKNQKVEQYSIGDPVTLVDGSEWHVIGTNGDKLVLILDKLVVDVTGYGKTANPEDQLYKNSIVKEYIDKTYAPELKKSLKSNGGDTNITVRILSAEEFIKGTGEKYGANCYNTVSSRTKTFYDYVDKKFTEFYVYEGASTLTAQDKFVATLALTDNFWTMSNVTERTSSECKVEEMYKGAYYVKISHYDGSSGSKSAYADLKMDWEAVYLTSNGKNFGDEEGTSAGIRPVIETSLKNVK